MKLSRVMGFVYIMMAGLIYTLERGFSYLSTSTETAGALAGENTGEMPGVSINGFFDNLFVPVFIVLGVILLIYGFSKSESSK